MLLPIKNSQKDALRIYKYEIWLYFNPNRTKKRIIITEDAFMEDSATTPPETNSGAAQPQTSNMQIISGFWRRIAALIIDFIILGLIGAILGGLFGDLFVKLGSYGRLLGYGIALLYFGSLNSSIGKGKTLGKRLMGIEVVNRQGNHISPGLSFLRFAILGAPFFLNNTIHGECNIIINVLEFLIVGALGISIVYLFVFNTGTRQSVHDIILSTYVIKSPNTGEIPKKSVWKVHYVILALIISFLFIVGVILSSIYKKQDLPLQPLREKLMASGQYHNVIVSANIAKYWNSSRGVKTEKKLFIVLFQKSKDLDITQTTKRTTGMIISDFPQLTQGVDKISIMSVYGYDIGIWSFKKTHIASNSLAEWKTILNAK